ncbi:MAG TPA: multicopper oxidase domain-containing protein [Pyrinomonadaceae bacterium]|nr:multicopper oxidase domain-containing protein [Pyrinomonadaceae bacterium]
MSKVSRRRRKEQLDAAHNRREIVAAGLSRREMMKMGLLTASGVLVAKRGLSARALDSAGQPTGQCPSPQTTPFVEPLPTIANGGMVRKQPKGSLLSPAPTVAPNTAINPATGLPFEGRTRSHQLLGNPNFDPRNDPNRLYEVRQQAANISIHPNLPLQPLWGFDGRVPGPIYVAHYGQPILVRNYNDLPDNNGGYGINKVSTHLHNGHTPSESDGFPCDWFRKGQFYDHHYPNVLAGFSSTHQPGGDPNEAMSTLWYHDHKVEFTAQNSYKGLAGFYLLFNDKDTGNETTGFRLPSFPDFDIPLMLNDKVIDPCTGLLFFDLFNDDGILGDKFLVNGKIQPFFNVQPRRYRFRILDGGPSRFYQLFLTDLASPSTVNQFWQISNDGNLLPKPIKVSSLKLGVAERSDIVIDFRPLAGKTVYLENRLIQQDGRGPMGEQLKSAGQGNLLLKFVVGSGTVPDNSVNFETTNVTFYPLPPRPTPRITRTFRFDRTNGMWAINNKLMDSECQDLRLTVQKNSAERWILQNNSGGWQHPVHIHFEEFQIVRRNNTLIPTTSVEHARKDVVRLRENEEIEIIMRFRDFVGRYPMHCHNTIHEDHAMMLRWDIANTGDNNTNP